MVRRLPETNPGPVSATRGGLDGGRGATIGTALRRPTEQRRSEDERDSDVDEWRDARNVRRRGGGAHAGQGGEVVLLVVEPLTGTDVGVEDGAGGEDETQQRERRDRKSVV